MSLPDIRDLRVSGGAADGAASKPAESQRDYAGAGFGDGWQYVFVVCFLPRSRCGGVAARWKHGRRKGRRRCVKMPSSKDGSVNKRFQENIDNEG